jgi:hypothetical protein
VKAYLERTAEYINCKSSFKDAPIILMDEQLLFDVEMKQKSRCNCHLIHNKTVLILLIGCEQSLKDKINVGKCSLFRRRNS